MEIETLTSGLDVLSTTEQRATPYADSVRQLVGEAKARLLVPGHGGGPAVSERLTQLLGEPALNLDVTSMLWGVDRTASDGLKSARTLAASAYGARKTWFLTNGSSQGNRMALIALASRETDSHTR
ncbi:hypothetical protein CQ020_06295 [Arthrobacter sp. MYb23]|uniref:hypothetical protein n=1 Tax=unclassified Arthrobacter TaxID=235627 RepID=UPI000CFCE6A3|nr:MULTISPECIES: hypothetical protein [unclassified Arthrobacter]PRB43099.1 hypothetical protein CQ038_08920 [Arthrobacter sp. MYb51]PRB98052.1 hypothetical protein CQ020_06295 [Arthrobacter sp. MYb23]